MPNAKINLRAMILKAALQLMNQYGYGGLTLSGLARQAKITKQRLYYHFANPEAVILVLAEDWSRSGQKFAIAALANTHDIGALKVLAVSEGMFRWMQEDFDLARLGLVIYQSSPHIKKLNIFMEQRRHTARERIKSLLLQDEVFHTISKLKLEDAVTAIHSVMYGFYFYIITMNDFKNLKTHEINCNESLRRIIQSFSK